MKLVYVRWRDAMKEEAESGGPAKPTLMTLEEIGCRANGLADSSLETVRFGAILQSPAGGP